jgi:hypothetical protein
MTPIRPVADSEDSFVDAERVVERLSEDESLRGELLDDGYGPLLGIVSDLAVQSAPVFKSTNALYRASRQLLIACVEAAETRDGRPVVRSAREFLPADRIRALARMLSSLSPDSDENSRMIAASLASVSAPATAERSDHGA